jgi:predicted RNase H-like HicB family nuclease
MERQHEPDGGVVKIKVIVQEAEEGGYWAEVPAIPGCATQGETMEELMANVHEAIEACLSVDVGQPESTARDKVLELFYPAPLGRVRSCLASQQGS